MTVITLGLLCGPGHAMYSVSILFYFGQEVRDTWSATDSQILSSFGRRIQPSLQQTLSPTPKYLEWVPIQIVYARKALQKPAILAGRGLDTRAIRGTHIHLYLIP